MPLLASNNVSVSYFISMPKLYTEKSWKTSDFLFEQLHSWTANGKKKQNLRWNWVSKALYFDYEVNGFNFKCATHLKWKDQWLIAHLNRDHRARCSRNNKMWQFVAGSRKSSINHRPRDRFMLCIIVERVSDVENPARLVSLNWNHLEIQLRNDLRPFVRLVTIININMMFDLYFSSLDVVCCSLEMATKSERSSEGDGNAHFVWLETSFASSCFFLRIE